MAGLKVITPPVIEPVTWEDVVFQLRYDDPDPETIAKIESLIITAREWCEGYQNRAYILQTLELALDHWPCGNEIELPRPPLQSVTSLIYTDSEGNDITWDASNYVVDNYAFVGCLVKRRFVHWPSVSLIDANGIRIQYVAGYGDKADDVPQKIRDAITLLASHWFDHGVCPPPQAVYSLLDMDRVVPL